MSERTKTTETLVPGDKVRWQTATTDKGILLPLSEEHPGEVITVLGVEPWILTAGPKAGQQARQGRAKNSPLLFKIAISDEDARRINARPAATADQAWVVA